MASIRGFHGVRYQSRDVERPLANNRMQEPGGSNRVVLDVEDLPAHIESMKKAGCRFRNEMEEGPAGKQIQLEDPDGNPVELFEAAR